MRVQRLISPGTELPSFTVIGSDALPVQPVESFLSLLSALGRSPNTVRAYAYDLKAFFDFLDRVGLRWDEVTLEDLVDFIASLRDLPLDNVLILRPSDGGRRPSTINRILNTVERFYQYHQRAGHPHALTFALQNVGPRRTAQRGFLAHIAREPRHSSFLRITLPRTIPDVLRPEQVQVLLESCSDIRDLLLLSLLYDTGMRVGAALGLRHSDVDPRRGVVHVVDRRDNSNGARTKGAKGDVCASPEWFHLYNRYMHEIYGDLDCDYVFVNLWRAPIGEPMTYNGVRELVVGLRRKTGIHFTAHTFRHTHATEMHRHDVPLVVISKRLMHRQLATTSGQYLHPSPDEMRTVLQGSGFWPRQQTPQ